MREITERDVDMARTVANTYCRKTGFQRHEDVVGDALEGLARAARDFDGRGTWTGYAYTRVFNSIMDGARREARQTRGR